MMILLIVILGTSVPLILMFFWKRSRPPFLSYHTDGTITDEMEYDKPLHRVNGPALIIRNYREEYWVDGYQHNFNGPSTVEHGFGGSTEYHVHGIELKKETFLKVRYCNKEDIALYLVSSRKEIRELAEHRLKELL